MDILCQAKSGMGKTAVFVLATLQQIEPVDGQVKRYSEQDRRGGGILFNGIVIVEKSKLFRDIIPLEQVVKVMSEYWKGFLIFNPPLCKC